LAVLLSVAFCPSTFAAQQNILLIIADDYGADSSSLYNTTANGASLPPTPTIDSLARRAVVFRNAWACPECSPSRAAMLTGRYPFRTGVGDALSPGDTPLAATEYTLPKAFSNNAANYHLAHFGKWHLALGPNTPKTVGGWSNYVGCLTGALVSSYSNWTKTSNGTQTAGYTNYATTDLVNDATNWIATRGTNPWFAWIAFNAPHAPFHVPPASLAPGYATNTGVAANRRQFEAMTQAMDTEMARLLSVVDTNNTHIIFCGDNGTQNNLLQPPYPSGRGKSTLYEGGIKVPFFICGPAVVNPGRTNCTPVHLVDVFSTILELAGINVATTLTNTTNAMDSKSLLPILQKQPDAVRYTFSEFYGTNFPANSGRAIRNSGYKLIHLTNSTELFYNLATDPYENTNLLPLATGTVAWSNYNALVLRLSDYQSVLTAPAISNVVLTDKFFTVTVPRDTSVNYTLWRAAALDDLAWAPASNVQIFTNGTTDVTLKDSNAIIGPFFYRVMATMP
jgi:arylsulfatase A-like enzyme